MNGVGKDSAEEARGERALECGGEMDDTSESQIKPNELQNLLRQQYEKLRKRVSEAKETLKETNVLQLQYSQQQRQIIK